VAVVTIVVPLERQTARGDDLVVGDPRNTASKRCRDRAVRRQESVRALGFGASAESDGIRKVSPSWRCAVLDVALVALTIAVFAVLALILNGLERL
jgi:hypothetical protein